MIILLFKIVIFIMSAYILFHSIRTINSMHWGTNHLVRLFFTAMSSAALYEIINIISGNGLCAADYLFVPIISISMFFDRRNDFKCSRYQDILR